MKLRIISLLAALCLLLSGTAHATAQEQRKTPTAFGIDVSHHQGSIDWDTLAPHIDFAILRCGYGANRTEQDDRQWKNNADACTRLGIPFGVYIYSHATTEAEALDEAQHVLRLVEGYRLSMPIYLDLEDQELIDHCTRAQILGNTKVFCEAVQAAGYPVGIYANTYWWTTYLTDPYYDNWDRWIARYAEEPGYNGEYSMWQYSSKGVLPGITANTVDLNHWYGEKPTVEHDCTYEPRILKEAGCTVSGLIRYTCPICGDFYETIVQAYGHNWSEGSITQEPAPGVSGRMTYVCLRCGETKEEIIPALPPVEVPPCNGGENCPGAKFTDMPEAQNWSHTGVDYALNHGLFNGMDETHFGPDIPMSRAMLVTVLWRYSGSPTGYENVFSDVASGLWYTDAIAWAAEDGIVSGMGEGLFDPDGHLTREQLALILFRFSGAEATGSSDLFEVFADGEDLSPWAQEALSWAVETGLIGGTLEDEVLYLTPQGSATRAQVATILMRYLEG